MHFIFLNFRIRTLLDKKYFIYHNHIYLAGKFDFDITMDFSFLSDSIAFPGTASYIILLFASLVSFSELSESEKIHCEMYFDRNYSDCSKII